MSVRVSERAYVHVYMHARAPKLWIPHTYLIPHLLKNPDKNHVVLVQVSFSSSPPPKVWLLLERNFLLNFPVFLQPREP